MTREQLDAIRARVERHDAATLYHAPTDLRALLAEVERLTAERDDAKHHLSELLARIHGDGGHYEASIGTTAAVEEADFIVSGLFGRADERADAFSRGVAAMREAAADSIDCRASDCPCHGKEYAAHLRALPDPEDKS